MIYVGKAKNLKRRVSSYFLARADHSPKVRDGRQDRRPAYGGRYGERSVVAGEQHDQGIQPRYNILLKDDKTYPGSSSATNRSRGCCRPGVSCATVPSISVLMLCLYPERDSANPARIYQLRTCSLNLSPKRLPREVQRLSRIPYRELQSPCVGRQSEEEYRESIGMVASLLKGDTGRRAITCNG